MCAALLVHGLGLVVIARMEFELPHSPGNARPPNMRGASERIFPLEMPALVPIAQDVAPPRKNQAQRPEELRPALKGPSSTTQAPAGAETTRMPAAAEGSVPVRGSDTELPRFQATETVRAKIVGPREFDARLMPSATAGSLQRNRKEILDSTVHANTRTIADSMNALVAAELAGESIRMNKRMGQGNALGIDAGGLHLGKFTIGMQMSPATSAGGSATQRLKAARSDIDRIEFRTLGDAAFRKSMSDQRAAADRARKKPPTP
ncbi:MAG: hypothetical protein H7Z40_15060 [Phycisphaerae bacterium]|nr:hypothetical protein [Gemmatimonadaceae bacterium]